MLLVPKLHRLKPQRERSLCSGRYRIIDIVLSLTSCAIQGINLGPDLVGKRCSDLSLWYQSHNDNLNSRDLGSVDCLYWRFWLWYSFLLRDYFFAEGLKLDGWFVLDCGWKIGLATKVGKFCHNFVMAHDDESSMRTTEGIYDQVFTAAAVSQWIDVVRLSAVLLQQLILEFLCTYHSTLE